MTLTDKLVKILRAARESAAYDGNDEERVILQAGRAWMAEAHDALAEYDARKQRRNVMNARTLAHIGMRDADAYTAEPWAVGKDGDVWAHNGTHCVHVLPDTLDAEANARRIVACVNACAGMPTEEIEAFGLGELADCARLWTKDSE